MDIEYITHIKAYRMPEIADALLAALYARIAELEKRVDELEAENEGLEDELYELIERIHG